MPPTLKETTTTFDKPEPIFEIKCDVHPWMSGLRRRLHASVFSATGPDGKFTISGLDAGTYEITAWHEVLGIADRHGHGCGHGLEDPGLQVRHERK